MRLALIALAAATALTPLSWKKTTPYAEVSLSLPGEVRHAPVLADRLYRGEQKALNDFAAQAADPKDGYRSTPSSLRTLDKWQMEVIYKVTVETPRLISLVREEDDGTNAMHSHSDLSGVVFDRVTKQTLGPTDLLRRDADYRRLNDALCIAAQSARLNHGGLPLARADCPHWLTWHNSRTDKDELKPPKIALAASEVHGRAGGVVFLFSPYEFGSYAEGEYRIVVPRSIFQGALKPEYAREFAGAPRGVHEEN